MFIRVCPSKTRSDLSTWSDSIKRLVEIDHKEVESIGYVHEKGGVGSARMRIGLKAHKQK
jgi:hypothetical protein